MVSNVGNYGENTVAEHTFALILALARRLRDSDRAVRTGHFSREGLRGFDLRGRTMGVVGAGRVGLHVIRIAIGFGMKVVAYDAEPHAFYSELLDFRYATFGELLREADVIDHPLEEGTLLGPLATAAAVERFRGFLGRTDGRWLQRGEVYAEVEGRRGYYVRPAVLEVENDAAPSACETFSPFATLEHFVGTEDAVRRQAMTPFGLTASIFTASPEVFRCIGDQLEVGNLYHNLPTTFSPSTLPFGGLGASGNGKPGGRGFVRFAGEEQAVQWLRQ